MRSAAAAPARAARAPPLRVARRHAPRAAAPPPRASGAGGERDRIARDVLGAPGYDSLPADLKAAVAETAGDEQVCFQLAAPCFGARLRRAPVTPGGVVAALSGTGCAPCPQAGPVESLREEGFAANLAQPEMMQGYARLVGGRGAASSLGPAVRVASLRIAMEIAAALAPGSQDNLGQQGLMRGYARLVGGVDGRPFRLWRLLCCPRACNVAPAPRGRAAVGDQEMVRGPRARRAGRPFTVQVGGRMCVLARAIPGTPHLPC